MNTRCSARIEHDGVLLFAHLPCTYAIQYYKAHQPNMRAYSLVLVVIALAMARADQVRMTALFPTHPPHHNSVLYTGTHP